MQGSPPLAFGLPRCLRRLAFGEPDVRLDVANGEQHGLSSQREADVCYVVEIEQTVPVLVQMGRRKRFSHRFLRGRGKAHGPYAAKAVPLREGVEEPAIRRPEGLSLIHRGASGQGLPFFFRNRTVFREARYIRLTPAAG